jgi:hypothetical protein
MHSLKNQLSSWRRIFHEKFDNFPAGKETLLSWKSEICHHAQKSSPFDVSWIMSVQSCTLKFYFREITSNIIYAYMSEVASSLHVFRQKCYGYFSFLPFVCTSKASSSLSYKHVPVSWTAELTKLLLMDFSGSLLSRSWIQILSLALVFPDTLNHCS